MGSERIEKGLPFYEKQRSYLEAKFNLGQSTGRKVDPDFVAKEMRQALDSDGKRLFRPSEFLTGQQITSLFTRLAAKLRHQVVATEVTFALWRRRQTFKRQEKSFYPRLK